MSIKQLFRKVGLGRKIADASPALREPEQSGEQTYTLPAASDSVRGGVRIGSGLSMAGDVLSAAGGAGGGGACWLNIDRKGGAFGGNNPQELSFTSNPGQESTCVFDKSKLNVMAVSVMANVPTLRLAAGFSSLGLSGSEVVAFQLRIWNQFNPSALSFQLHDAGFGNEYHFACPAGQTRLYHFFIGQGGTWHGWWCPANLFTA